MHVPLIFGGIIVEPAADGDRRHARLRNTALATNASGDVVGRYDKQFLLAFGEYIPFGETFPSLYDVSPNCGRFTPGTELDPLPRAEPGDAPHHGAHLLRGHPPEPRRSHGRARQTRICSST